MWHTRLPTRTEKVVKMAKIDLSNCSLNELKRLEYDVEKEITERRQEELGKARQQIISMAQALSLSVEELFDAIGNKTKDREAGTLQARYRNPADSQQTWTGRGRQPKWVGEALANGRNLEDFRIH
jgi:DNA-binding protein H-NS